MARRAARRGADGFRRDRAARRGPRRSPRERRHDRLAVGMKVAAHVYALGPLAIAVFVTLAGRLTANPIEDLTRRFGQDALLMLTLSLAVSPSCGC